MTLEHFLPALIIVIPGIVVLIYGIVHWEFTGKDLLMFVLIVLGTHVLIHVTVTWGPTGKVLPDAVTWKHLLPVLAAIPGIIAFFWRVLDHYRSYLHITLRVDLKDDRFPTAMTVVENKSISKKRLSNALLLIGPEHESPIETMSQLNLVVEHTNDIVKLKIHNAVPGPGGRSLIPLPFFYSENVRISDEKVSYRAPIDTRYIPRGVPYSVRFFISAPERLHRTTHDSFVLPSSAP